MYIIRKKGIREVEILNMINKSECEILVKDTGTLEIIDRISVYDSLEEAQIGAEEIEIVKNYKRKRRNKKGELTCKCCGATGKDLTVDHIKSLKSFGGRKEIRKNKALWSKAWNHKNFQILCEECNQFKSSMSQEEFERSMDIVDLKARALNNSKKLKKTVNKNTPANKTSYGIATSEYAKNKKYLAEKIAKSDSNVLRLDLILQNMEVYETLPNTNL